MRCLIPLLILLLLLGGGAWWLSNSASEVETEVIEEDVPLQQEDDA